MSKIIKLEEAETFLSNNRILLITGSFDILHLGHLRFLQLAKQRVPRDVKSLVVVLSDEEIAKRKGAGRPIFKLNERIEALSYIESVDYIIPWEQPWENLRDFVEKNKPAYLALVERDPGYENKVKYIESSGGKAIVIEPLEGLSTSSIINKLDL